MQNKISFVFLLLIVFAFSISAQNSGAKKSAVGIDENLGGYLPLETKFTNDNGELVTLKQVITKPTILLFVYFECPGLCTPLMNEVASQVSKIDLEPGIDYNIVAISMDHAENYNLAAKKKKNYIAQIKRAFPENAWTFLTGDSISIASTADSVGFRFKKEEDQFIHAGALIMISPEGKITRYLLGTEFLPFDIKMALIEAAEGKATPTIAKVLQFCFKYDAEGKKYVLQTTRIFGVITLLGAGIFVFLITRKNKKIKKRTDGESS